MATTTIDIGTMIVRSSDIRGGRPRIAGTGVTVQRIAELFKSGMNPDEIASEFGHLTYAQIYAAIAYYHANPAEIEAALAEDQAAGDRAEADWRRSRKTTV